MNLLDTELLVRLSELSDEEKHRRILDGLTDVDSGRTISHEEIVAWVQSLFERPNSLN